MRGEDESGRNFVGEGCGQESGEKKFTFDLP